MNKLLTAGAMLATMSGAALAADLPSRVPPPPPPVVPIYTWTGAYFGINAGYAFDNQDRFRALNGTVSAATSGVGTARPALVTGSSDGFSGGGQIGYNYQLGGFGSGFGGFGGFGLGSAALVIGVEADAAYTDLTKQRTVAGVGLVGNTFGPVANTYRSNLDFLGTVRGRLGLAFNQFMIYGTGGFAYGGANDSVAYFNPNGSYRYFGKRDRIETGYAYGGGFEYLLPTNSFLNALNVFKSSAVTLKVEYLRYDLGARTINLSTVAGGGGTGLEQSRLSTEGNIVRAGINYKFGSY